MKSLNAYGYFLFIKSMSTIRLEWKEFVVFSVEIRQ